MHTVYLALGSNLGNREINLQKAITCISSKLKIQRLSSIYDTLPVGDIQQPRFLNLVIEAKTNLTPLELLKFGKRIEIKMGRKPAPANNPRPIDIDILFYDNIILDTPTLVIPHPRLSERVFVLLPLFEISPRMVHPTSGKTVKELLKSLKWTANDIEKWDNKEMV